jgi:hypothetical protein
MYRHLFKFAVTTITILTVNLLTGKLTDYMVSYKTHYKPLTFTLVAMGIITVIFYPLIAHMEDWLNNLSARLVTSGRSLGGKYLGLIIVFALCLAVLLYFYARMWYNINIIHILFQGKIRSQF